MCCKGNADIQMLHLKYLTQTLRQLVLEKKRIVFFRDRQLYFLFSYRAVLSVKLHINIK